MYNTTSLESANIAIVVVRITIKQEVWNLHSFRSESRAMQHSKCRSMGVGGDSVHDKHVSVETEPVSLDVLLRFSDRFLCELCYGDSGHPRPFVQVVRRSQILPDHSQQLYPVCTVRVTVLVRKARRTRTMFSS